MPKRGRPSTDQIDRIRAKIWYKAVKSRTEWSDYQLDIEFVRDKDEGKRDGPRRRRAFERIRRLGVVPSSGNHHARKYDLVAQVDSHPRFMGTADVFRSPFWELLKARAMALPQAHALVAQCMNTFNVFRPSGKLHFIWEVALANRIPETTQLSGANKYRVALRQVLQEKPLDLNQLALIGALFREAYLTCALDIATVLRDEFVDRLQQYCDQDWLGDMGSELLQLAERRALYWGVEPELEEGKIYDDWPEQVVSRPLLCADEASLQLARQENELFSKMSKAFRALQSAELSGGAD